MTKCLKKSLLLFFIFLSLIKPIQAMPKQSETLSLKEQLTECKIELNEIKNSYDLTSDLLINSESMLTQCELDKKDLENEKDEKVLFFFDSKNVAYFGIGLILGIVL